MVDVRLAGNTPFTLFVHLTVAILAGIVAFTAAAGIVDSMPIASVASVGAIAAALVWLRRHAGVAGALARVQPVYRRVFVVGAVAALGQLLALTVFIIDPHVATWRPHVWAPQLSQHSCVSSYLGGLHRHQRRNQHL